MNRSQINFLWKFSATPTRRQALASARLVYRLSLSILRGTYKQQRPQCIHIEAGWFVIPRRIELRFPGWKPGVLTVRRWDQFGCLDQRSKRGTNHTKIIKKRQLCYGDWEIVSEEKKGRIFCKKPLFCQFFTNSYQLGYARLFTVFIYILVHTLSPNTPWKPPFLCNWLCCSQWETIFRFARWWSIIKIIFLLEMQWKLSKIFTLVWKLTKR